MNRPLRRSTPALRWLLAAVVVLASTSSLTAIAAAADYHFCGQKTTFPSSTCWHNDGGHYYDYADATYTGSGSFDICVKFSDWGNHGSVPVKKCTPNGGVGYDTFIRYCGNYSGSPNLRLFDAGVAHHDNNGHTIYGFARVMAGDPCF